MADDINGTISKYSPTGNFDGTFASGLTNPLSLVFDNQGNLYVGQQGTPYIAEFNSSGQSIGNFGPLTTGETGDDWIALSSDECTFYYTTETDVIYRYNKCTNTQLSTFNVAPFTGDDAYELQILPNGNVLVADSESDIMLDPNGNVVGSYSCANLPGCSDELFAIALDPDGLSFWTGDTASGIVYRIDIASGDVLQTIDTRSPYLFGLSVDNEIEVAAPPPTTTTVPSTLTVQPVTGNFSTPTPVSAVLTNPGTDTPIVNEPVTFTLNGSETCTADTDSTGTATCDLTANEPSSSYTLTASFPGDTTTSTPIGSNSSTSTFTVNPDTTALTYTGATTAVNGSSTTLSGTLTTDTPTAGTPLPTKVVTFTIGSGGTAQSCSGTTDTSGDVSCTIQTVDQPQTAETVTSSFSGRRLRHAGDSDDADDRDRADHADRQPRNRELLGAHHGLRRAAGHHHQHADRRRAGDLHPQRDRDLHRHDRRHGHGLVHHHSRRGRCDLPVHPDRDVRRRLHASSPAAHARRTTRPTSSSRPSRRRSPIPVGPRPRTASR